MQKKQGTSLLLHKTLFHFLYSLFHLYLSVKYFDNRHTNGILLYRLDIFVCGDQIRKGAALNAVQIAELLL